MNSPDAIWISFDDPPPTSARYHIRELVDLVRGLFGRRSEVRMKMKELALMYRRRLTEYLVPPARQPHTCPTFLPSSELLSRMTRLQCLLGARMLGGFAQGTADSGEAVEYLHFSSLGSCHLGPFEQLVRLPLRQERTGEYSL